MELVKEIPRGTGGAFGLHPVTKALADKVNTLKAGQIAKFKLPSSREAENRASSLRDLSKKKSLTLKRIVQRGNELYVEK